MAEPGLIALPPKSPAMREGWSPHPTPRELRLLLPQDGRERGVSRGEWESGEQGQTMDGLGSHAQLEGLHICENSDLQATDSCLD